MERGKNKKKSNQLADRGLSVKICPLGTGILLQQSNNQNDEFSAHLTLAEARELSVALVAAVQNAQQAMIGTKSVSSLYARGFRIDQIAFELNLTIKEVREQLSERGLQKDPD